MTAPPLTADTYPDAAREQAELGRVVREMADENRLLGRKANALQLLYMARYEALEARIVAYIRADLPTAPDSEYGAAHWAFCHYGETR